MKIEKIIIKNFRCFGPTGVEISFDSSVTAFVGANGSGKTAVFQALARLFGVTPTQRLVQRQDFHIPPDQHKLQSETELSIEVIFSFPELEGIDEEGAEDAVPQLFLHMAASAPGAPLKVRMRLQAKWIDDGTPDGSIDEDLRWITTFDDKFKWEECTRVQAIDRGSIQLIYVPAVRNAAAQVTTLLKGRLWRAARWSSEFQDKSAITIQNIQQQFEREEPTEFIVEQIAKRWQQVHEADTYTTPTMRLIESRFEELIRNAEFTFSPDEAGQERALADLSDGQRSLFHIALATATLEVEKNVFKQAAYESMFDQEKLRRTCLTLLAIEEPENNLSPFFLPRIITQAREIGNLASAQVALSSHSPAILSRIEPQEVRYFRLDRKQRCAYAQPLKLPENDDEASRHVRLAIRAYPEIYFARFVILGEGDSERLVIPRIADAMNIQLDPSFVPIVPLGGRYVGHFWRLLDDLQIPHATLLDLDLGRAHGGRSLITDVVAKLKEIDNDMSKNFCVDIGLIDLSAMNDIEDNDLMNEGKQHAWLQALEEEGVFFSFPLDIDFSMLKAFPEAYQHPNPGGYGPRDDGNPLLNKKNATLKTGGNPDLYDDDDYDDEFKWYPYLFLNRSKPETHIVALTRIEKNELARSAPPEIGKLLEQVKNTLETKGKDA